MSSTPAPKPNRAPLRHGDRSVGPPREIYLPAIRVSPSERHQIDGEAESFGLALSAYMRRIIVGRRLPRAVPAVNREQWARLGALAADLNRLSAASREGNLSVDVLPLLEELKREISALRASLLGDDPAPR
jgi:hypothetical protein